MIGRSVRCWESRALRSRAAINSALAHLEGYIAALDTRMLYDEHGCPCQYLDPELKRRLETKLIVRVLKFKLV